MQDGDLRHSPFTLKVIGLGSEGRAGVTLKAQEALGSLDAVIGYKLYMDQAEPFIRPGAQKIASGMTAETKRAEEAIKLAQGGLKVGVVSGGDPGIYAMAGVVFEVAAALKVPLGEKAGELSLQVIPGIPALAAGAALLGAPLTHDFCAISLSDRLTDWEKIKKRLDLASQADFVIVLYNPRSHGRPTRLREAADILLKNLPPATPVGVASRVGRAGESAQIVTLGSLNVEEVDMQTILFIGNVSSFVYRDRLVTPRGYVRKYGVVA
ncbi:MAG: precorrin-3B C(17)-methyltransferase [Deltaproteobacteria bacterium]|jgi:precorrin-3B C17-methyltransferase|nr:precorrin-3B C(17)-methyltransferase [Deltaproteobacteria bacterium]